MTRTRRWSTQSRICLLLLAVAGLIRAQAQAPSSQRANFLKLIDRARVPLAPETSALPPRGRFAREHFTFATETGGRVPGLTLRLANSAGRRPAVIVMHGTGDSKEGMAPLLEPLADRGFLAVGPNDYVRAILQAYRTGQKHPFLYDTVWDAMRLVDYLESRPDIDRSRIAFMGISKGGMETYLAAAVDPRIAAAVPVIGVQSFGWALANDAWQARIETILPAVAGAARDGLTPVDGDFVQDFYDRVVPGIYAEFDAPAMLPLIAPRPLLVINGDSDALTPLPGVEESARAAEGAYRRAGAAEKFRLLVQPDTGHEFTPEARQTAFDWLVRWLKP
jgi:dipeptidyl aminopeptidase/acylaminoacyl peptidase